MSDHIPAAKIEVRLRTFTDFPRTSPVRKEALAPAGFVYDGTRDSVTCFHCRLRLHDWIPCNPLEEHLKFSRWMCEFAKREAKRMNLRCSHPAHKTNVLEASDVYTRGTAKPHAIAHAMSEYKDQADHENSQSLNHKSLSNGHHMNSSPAFCPPESDANDQEKEGGAEGGDGSKNGRYEEKSGSDNLEHLSAQVAHAWDRSYTSAKQKVQPQLRLSKRESNPSEKRIISSGSDESTASANLLDVSSEPLTVNPHDIDSRVNDYLDISQVQMLLRQGVDKTKIKTVIKARLLSGRPAVGSPHDLYRAVVEM